MKKECVMEAVFTEEAYKALMNGEAVDNNGLRSSKGSYWPDQPYYRPKNNYQEKIKEAKAGLAIFASGYILFNIILPNCKRFTDEKIYPFLAEKFDDWAKRKKKEKEIMEKQAIITRTSEKVNESKVIDFVNHRKRA